MIITRTVAFQDSSLLRKDSTKIFKLTEDKSSTEVELTQRNFVVVHRLFDFTPEGI